MITQLTMAKPDMVGPWERHDKLTRVLYQSEIQCILAQIFVSK
jgi:hypothetical protein